VCVCVCVCVCVAKEHVLSSFPPPHKNNITTIACTFICFVSLLIFFVCIFFPTETKSGPSLAHSSRCTHSKYPPGTDIYRYTPIFTDICTHSRMYAMRINARFSLVLSFETKLKRNCDCYIYIYICIYIYIHTHVCVCIRKFTQRTHTQTERERHTHTHININIYTYIYIYIRVCVWNFTQKKN
jgi:hypothetical protein